MPELIRQNHSKYLLLAHIILVCKYRKRLLDVIGDAIKRLLKECAVKNNFTITEMECEKDHIHLLVN